MRKLTWQERRDLLTPEQREGSVDEKGYRNGFGDITPFTDWAIHLWLDNLNIPTHTETDEEK